MILKTRGSLSRNQIRASRRRDPPRIGAGSYGRRSGWRAAFNAFVSGGYFAGHDDLSSRHHHIINSYYKFCSGAGSDGTALRTIDADHDDQDQRPLGEPETGDLRPQLQHAAATGEAIGGVYAQGGAVASSESKLVMPGHSSLLLRRLRKLVCDAGRPRLDSIPATKDVDGRDEARP